MKKTNTPINGLFLIEFDTHFDVRGSFSRLACRDQFEELGLESDWVQLNASYSAHTHTLRGLHFQVPPKMEDKLVYCLSGSVWDVAVDLRPGSNTFGISFGVELSQNNNQALLVPKGLAHGYLTLEDHSVIVYLVSSNYSPNEERTLKWNDPSVNIKWPTQPKIISEKDSRGSALDQLNLEGMAHSGRIQEIPLWQTDRENR